MILFNPDRFLRLFKEGTWIAVGQLVSIVGSIVLVRVITEYLDPARYGELALGLTVGGFINQVVMGGIGGGIGRFYSIAAEKRDLKHYLIASGSLMGWATLSIVVIGIILIIGLLSIGLNKWIPLAVAMLFLSILTGFNSTLSGIQNAARQRQIVALHGGMDAWLKIALAVVVMYWLGKESVAVVIGYALSAFVVTVSQLIFLVRLVRSAQGIHGEASITGENWAAGIWRFAWPFSVWGPFTWLQQASDRWALQFFASTEDVGSYAVLYQLSFVPIALASGLLVSLISPILYQRVGDATVNSRVKNMYKITRNIALFVMAMTAVGATIVGAFHEQFYQLLTMVPPVSPRSTSRSSAPAGCCNWTTSVNFAPSSSPASGA